MASLSRSDLWRLLAAAPPARREVRVTEEGETEGVRWRRLELVGRRVMPAFDLLPLPGARRCPVLYAHAHGNRPDIGKAEVLAGRPALLNPPLGLALARAGHRVLCPDMPGFGERQGDGPEGALAKALLWQGRTLLGVMVEDLSGGLDWLREETGEAPAVVGFSMGAFLAAVLGALRPEVGRVAHMCGMAEMAPLISSGAHDLHGPYLTIPGLLPRHDLPDIAALIAPRPQFVAAGLADPLTPPEAFGPLETRLREVYRDGSLLVHVAADAGHVETEAMRAALFGFLAQPDP